MLLTLLKLPMPRDQEKSKENWLLDLVLLPLNPLLTLNSVLVDYTLSFLQDQVNLVDDGYILEGEELAFYLRRLTAKK